MNSYTVKNGCIGKINLSLSLVLKTLDPDTHEMDEDQKFRKDVQYGIK
jgi:hypothetical protein